MTRAKLDLSLDADEAPPAVDPEAIRRAAASAGFRPSAPIAAPSSPAADSSAEVLRRGRRRTGRVHQFNTRLRADTVKAIQAYADRHELDSMAEVIERAMAALEREEASK